MKMQCKSCHTELAKHTKVCPKCGAKIKSGMTKNTKVAAIFGVIVMFIGGLLPFVQNVDPTNTDSIEIAYSFMNIQQPVYWYLFILALVISIVLITIKKEKISIISTVAATVIFGVSFFGSPYCEYVSKKAPFILHNLTDLLSDHQAYAIGLGVYVIIIGLIIAIVGCFFDVAKYFKKEIKVDPKYMSNSMNKNIWAKIKNYRWFYVMFLPVFIMVLLFNYWPMLGVRFAFTDYKIANPYYVGIKHFVGMATRDVFFWNAFRNTIILSVTKLLLNTGAAVVISLLLNEISNLTFKKTVQTIVYLPHFMSWVVVASLFRLILSPSPSGLVSSLLVQLHFLPDFNAAPFLLGDPKYWTGTFFVINVWKDTGWGTILFLATLSGISPELYEAAQIDGANRWDRMKFITIPALMNTIITVFILNLAKVMKIFESVFVLQNSAVDSVANVIQTYIYAKSFGVGQVNYGYTTAVGLFNSLIGVVLVLGCDFASKKVRGRGIV